MLVHLLSAQPVPGSSGSAGSSLSPGHPVHLPGDLSRALTERGHRVVVHRLLGARPGSWIPTLADVPALAGWVSARIGGARSALGGATSAVLHALDLVGWATALATRARTGIPVVLRWADDGDGASGDLTERRIRLACLRAADLVVVPGDRTRGLAVRAGAAPERVLLVPDPVGIPAPGVAPAPSGRTVVSLAGVGAPQVEVLLHALRGVPDAELVLAGPGSAARHRAARELLGRLGLTERVQLLGWVGRERAAQLLLSAAVVVCPSPGLGRTSALEAMWQARPVVALAGTSVADVVVDGVTGLVVPPRDPVRLAGALRSLLDDPFRGQALGLAGRNRAEARYALQRVAEAYEEAYRTAVTPPDDRLRPSRPG